MGRRASVVIDFNDQPAGMDNNVSPTVTLQLASEPRPLTLTQLSFSGDLWIGEVDIEDDAFRQLRRPRDWRNRSERKHDDGF